jgi:hypothetical protein
MLLSALVCALFATGCATVTRGVHESLVIESDPAGAKVALSTGETGATPTSFRIKRKGAVMVTISKDGYETVVINVTTQVAGAGAAGMAGNVLVGGVIGAGIDAFSGGMLEHKPNPVKVTMVALKAPVKEAAPAELKASDPAAPAVVPATTVAPVEANPEEKTAAAAASTIPAEKVPEGGPVAVASSVPAGML